MRGWTGLAVLTLLGACSPDNDISVQGVLGGRGFHARGAIFGTPTYLDLTIGAYRTHTVFALYDYADDACQARYSNMAPEGGQVLESALWTTTYDPNRLDDSVHEPGVYTCDDSGGTMFDMYAGMSLTIYHQDPNDPLEVSGPAACRVAVTGVSGDALAATIDATFKDGHIGGSFAATHCDALDYVH
jgi:hypothetical protein